MVTFILLAVLGFSAVLGGFILKCRGEQKRYSLFCQKQGGKKTYSPFRRERVSLETWFNHSFPPSGAIGLSFPGGLARVSGFYRFSLFLFQVVVNDNYISSHLNILGFNLKTLFLKTYMFPLSGKVEFRVSGILGNESRFCFRSVKWNNHIDAIANGGFFSVSFRGGLCVYDNPIVKHSLEVGLCKHFYNVYSFSFFQKTYAKKNPVRVIFVSLLGFCLTWKREYSNSHFAKFYSFHTRLGKRFNPHFGGFLRGIFELAETKNYKVARLTPHIHFIEWEMFYYYRHLNLEQ